MDAQQGLQLGPKQGPRKIVELHHRAAIGTQQRYNRANNRAFKIYIPTIASKTGHALRIIIGPAIGRTRNSTWP